MDIAGMLVTTMTYDLQHELKKVARLERCENIGEIAAILDNIVLDLERLAAKYRDMHNRLKEVAR